MRWNHAFSLLQMKTPDEAREELASLAQSAGDQVLQAAPPHPLDVVAKDDPSIEKKVASLRGGLRQRSTPQEMARTIEKASSNMEVVVLSRMLHDAVEAAFRRARRRDR